MGGDPGGVGNVVAAGVGAAVVMGNVVAAIVGAAVVMGNVGAAIVGAAIVGAAVVMLMGAAALGSAAVGAAVVANVGALVGVALVGVTRLVPNSRPTRMASEPDVLTTRVHCIARREFRG